MTLHQFVTSHCCNHRDALCCQLDRPCPVLYPENAPPLAFRSILDGRPKEVCGPFYCSHLEALLRSHPAAIALDPLKHPVLSLAQRQYAQALKPAHASLEDICRKLGFPTNDPEDAIAPIGRPCPGPDGSKEHPKCPSSTTLFNTKQRLCPKCKKLARRAAQRKWRRNSVLA
jgi:hypothetical protein